MKLNYVLGVMVVLLTTAAAVPGTTTETRGKVIKDGSYQANVEIRNRATRKTSLHKLNVMVESDRVVMIDFGDGNAVHAGYNNIGYVYSGGRLDFERDWSTQIITLASTTVKVVTKDKNTLTFDIRIE